MLSLEGLLFQLPGMVNICIRIVHDYLMIKFLGLFDPSANIRIKILLKLNIRIKFAHVRVANPGFESIP